VHASKPSVSEGFYPSGKFRAWSVVTLCTIAYMLSFVDRQILSLLVGPIRHDLQISDTQFGLLSGLAFALFYATIGLPIAGMADRSSRPRIIAIGIAMWSLATVTCGLSRSFVQLFLSRIAVGAGEAALSPATYSLIADLFPRERLGRALSVYALGVLLGSGMAFLLGGAVIAAISRASDYQVAGLSFAPWQITFMIVGAPGVLLAGVIALCIRDPRSEKRAREPAPPWRDIRSVMRRNKRIYLPLMLGFPMAAMGLFGILGWMPAYLMRQFGMGPQQVGYWLGAIAILCGGGGNLACGWMMDRLAARGIYDAPFRVSMVGAAGLALSITAVPFVTRFGPSIVLIAIAFFFASFPVSPSSAVMQIATPPLMRSRVSAVFLMCNSFIGLAFSSFLIGWLNDVMFAGRGLGFAMALVVAGAAVAAMCILHFGRAAFAARIAEEP
jgi:MFS family permease